MKAILIVDHGSRKSEANNMLICMANLVQSMAGKDVIVRHAHMELAEPSIEAGFANCVKSGATDVTVFPYMLSPGKHSTDDIPRMVAEAAKAHPGVRHSVTPAFGVHEKLGELILHRSGIPIASKWSDADAERCWDPARSRTLCGDACRAQQADITGFFQLPTVKRSK
ncbi:MAG TPA: CbiX/SirB N-terminal domain-containing protein [Gemmatimonadaceae bacterium]|jgi:sirohydrochlorin ferrochelatase|nr:CbiX/SirB N-terminal domain-containing protein [Gemmatimonadaceae bacterium]